MKKRIVSIMALSLVVTMGAVSLTGCGTRTKATDITIEDGDTIIVEEEDMETEAESDTDDITDTEVIGGDAEDAEESTDFAGAEDDNIVLYAEKEEQRKYLDIYDFDYLENIRTLSATSDIPVYDGAGFNVGHIKNGSTVEVEEMEEGIAWSRFKNPIEGTEYDYLYVMNDNFVASNQITVSGTDIVEKLTYNMNNRAYELPSILETPTSDMEVYEFRIPATYTNEVDFKDDIYFYSYDNGFSVGSYMTYAIETIEDGGDIICKIFYKDLYEDWVENQ